ncbi:MAG: YpiB family protein [Atopostipes sp.]|nr:YpiB family protein [Atopostipes sp.]
MNNKITNQQKKSFLKWLTKNYRFKVRESLWILDYLYNHDTMLAKSRFVEGVDQTPRGIYMSVSDQEQVDFVLYKNGHSYENPMKAFHEVRLNWSSTLYLEIDFEKSWQSEEYLAVLEDNPYAPWNEQITKESIAEMKKSLRYESLVQQKDSLLKELDQALESGDQKEFNQLSSEVQKLNQLINNLIEKD